MKIISKYKDYYDYLQGVYGIDNKIVLERNSIFQDYESNNFHYEGTFYWFSILDKQYLGILTDEGWIHKFEDLEKYYKENYSVHFQFSDLAKYLYGYQLPAKGTKLLKQYPDTLENREQNCPLIVNEKKFPLLYGTFIPSLISAHDMFIGLTAWLTPKDLVLNNDPKDMDRFIAKGFDKKISFRRRL